MKPTIFSSAPLFISLAGLLWQPAHAQSPVTSFSASYVTTTSAVTSYSALPAVGTGSFGGCSSLLYLYTFSNGGSNQYKLNNFNANGSTYFVVPASAATVKLRRVNNSNATGSRTIVYMESTFPSALACLLSALLSFKTPYLDAMETVLNAGMLNQGTDNIFTNAGNGDGNNNNIERVDITFPAGLNTSDPLQAGFAIFDRGANYAHDPFKIVAITSLDANGDPASFGAVKTCTGGNGSNNNGSWGHPSTLNGNLSFAAYVMRKDAADPWLRVSSNVNQEVGGVFYTFADLGITPGQHLYGYALLAADGTAAPSSSQLLNLANSSVYPTGTTETQGGLDLVAVNTVFSTGSYVVLPLQIVSFSGSLENGKSKLQWELENVEGNEQVSLEKSADGLSFLTVDTWSPGATAGLLPGEYTDQTSADNGVTYYRLKITPASGSVQYSQTLALHGDSGWKIYPTVALRSQMLRLQGLSDGYYSADFYDLQGRLRITPFQVINKEARIDQPADGLLPGIYWLKISGDGQSVPGGARILIR